MKCKFLASVSIALGMLAFPGLAHAQSGGLYELVGSTLAGGGGVSSGGGFAVSGTIGQPDAGAMSGGAFTLTGGFWSFVTIVTNAGAPELTIALTPAKTVRLSWPRSESGWRLQTTSSLSPLPVVWTDVAPPYGTAEASCDYVEALSSGCRYYRLQKP